MPAPSNSRREDSAAAAEHQRVRQRAAAARHGNSADCSLTVALRAALRRDPTLGLKKLTKIIQEEGGHPNASSKDIRNVLAAVESTAPPVRTEQEQFELMMQQRREAFATRKRESRIAGCMAVMGVAAIMWAVWNVFRRFDDA
jgi:hypothetical protein